MKIEGEMPPGGAPPGSDPDQDKETQELQELEDLFDQMLHGLAREFSNYAREKPTPGFENEQRIKDYLANCPRKLLRFPATLHELGSGEPTLIRITTEPTEKGKRDRASSFASTILELQGEMRIIDSETVANLHARIAVAAMRVAALICKINGERQFGAKVREDIVNWISISASDKPDMDIPEKWRAAGVPAVQASEKIEHDEATNAVINKIRAEADKRGVVISSQEAERTNLYNQKVNNELNQLFREFPDPKDFIDLVIGKDPTHS